MHLIGDQGEVAFVKAGLQVLGHGIGKNQTSKLDMDPYPGNIDRIRKTEYPLLNSMSSCTFARPTLIPTIHKRRTWTMQVARLIPDH